MDGMSPTANRLLFFITLSTLHLQDLPFLPSFLLSSLPFF
jgi:hypothetical protein